MTADYRVWIFGDTLLGSFATDCRKPLLFCDRQLAEGVASGPVHNSVGILRGSPGAYRPIERFWGETPNGSPTSFFSAEKADHYLWPLSGVRLEDRLIILANENSATSGLAPVSSVLLQILNPLDPPPEWKVQRRVLPHQTSTPKNPTHFGITSAVVREAGFLVFVGSRKNVSGEIHTILARLPVTALQDFEKPWPWEWWMSTAKAGPHWSSPLEAEKLAPVEGLPGSSESTFNKNSNHQWETYQIPIFSFYIHRFTATSIEGPWRDAGAVYQAPPPWSIPARRHCHRSILRSARTRPTLALRRRIARSPLCHTGNFVAYAPKSHPGLGPNGRETLTYNVNLFFGNLKGLVHAVENFPDFYVPRVIQAPRTVSPAGGEPESSQSE